MLDPQPAAFTADRGTVATGDFAFETDVQTTNQYYGLYFTDTLTLTDGLSLTLSGRFNRAHVKIENLGGPEDDPFCRPNWYRFQDVNGWKDLGPKWILQLYRDARATESPDLLRELLAMKILKMEVND